MFQNPFSFEGRIRRLEYGLSYIIYIVARGIITVLIDTSNSLVSSSISMLIFGVGFIAVFWFFLAQGAKRCHDRNNSGWYQIIPFYQLWMIFAEGDTGTNEFGLDPKNPDLNMDSLIDNIGKDDNEYKDFN